MPNIRTYLSDCFINRNLYVNLQTQFLNNDLSIMGLRMETKKRK
jgi:hypothetical protein